MTRPADAIPTAPRADRGAVSFPARGTGQAAERSQGDLDDVLDPVEAGRLRDTESPGDDRTEQCGNDTDHDREQDRHVLPARHNEPTKRTDDRTDDDRPDDGC